MPVSPAIVFYQGEANYTSSTRIERKFPDRFYEAGFIG
jgi:hypothetical protein